MFKQLFAPRADERSLATLPRWLWTALALALAAQIIIHRVTPLTRAPAGFESLGAPPPLAVLHAVSLGDHAALSRLITLYLQSFDFDAGRISRYQDLNYAHLEAWLGLALQLDPRDPAPLLLAAKLYADLPAPPATATAAERAAAQAKPRAMLAFVAREFMRDPNARWPWLAHAATLAKHRLGDLPLARQYARLIRENVTDPTVPSWARDMEIFILEDMSEIEQARVMLGGLVASGRITDPQEVARLAARLRQMERR